jgi:hypothetical protein
MEPRRLAPMSLGLFAAWSLLAALQLGWLPFARNAWAFDLWSYLPESAPWLLGAASLPLCVARVRDGISGCLLAAARRCSDKPLLDAAACAALAMGLWLLRERSLLADSAVLVAVAHSDHAFIFPEVGATTLLRGIARVAPLLGINAIEGMRALACVCGGAAAWLLLRVARELAPGRSAAVLALCVLSGGLLRVFAGRIEVYAPLLVAILAYLWLALRALRGGGSSALPGLCLGVAIWIHASSVLLLPSLCALVALRSAPARGRDAARELAKLLLLAGAPLALFLAAHGALSGSASILDAWVRALEILGGGSRAGGTRWWVRGWGGAPSIGTDVVWLSAAHLKYLSNSFTLLIPALLPALALLLGLRPRALVAGAQGRWLAIGALPLICYALALRPFWGPWDWDLFALTALLLACSCLRALAALRLAPGLLVACIGFQLCFFGIPLLWIGAGAPREVGPFGFRDFDYDLRLPARPPPERLAPWL